MFTHVKLWVAVGRNSKWEKIKFITQNFNPFKLEFTIVIFIDYKPRISTCSGWRRLEVGG